MHGRGNVMKTGMERVGMLHESQHLCFQLTPMGHMQGMECLTDLLRRGGMCNVGKQGGSVHACVHEVQGLAGSPPDLCITVPNQHSNLPHPQPALACACWHSLCNIMQAEMPFASSSGPTIWQSELLIRTCGHQLALHFMLNTR